MVFLKDIHNGRVSIDISMSSTVDDLFTAAYSVSTKTFPIEGFLIIWAGRPLENYKQSTLAEQNIVPNSLLFAVWKGHSEINVFPSSSTNTTSTAKQEDGTKKEEEKTKQQSEEDAPKFDYDE